MCHSNANSLQQLQYSSAYLRGRWRSLWVILRTGWSDAALMAGCCPGSGCGSSLGRSPQQVMPPLRSLLRVVFGVWKQACEVGQDCLGCSLSCACSVRHQTSDRPVDVSMTNDRGDSSYLKTVPSRLRSGPLGCTTLCLRS